jgi:hypothetical protein
LSPAALMASRRRRLVAGQSGVSIARFPDWPCRSKPGSAARRNTRPSGVGLPPGLPIKLPLLYRDRVRIRQDPPFAPRDDGYIPGPGSIQEWAVAPRDTSHVAQVVDGVTQSRPAERGFFETPIRVLGAVPGRGYAIFIVIPNPSPRRPVILARRLIVDRLVGVGEVRAHGKPRDEQPGACALNEEEENHVLHFSQHSVGG